MNKVLVTGGTGFIGYHLICALKDKGYEITSGSLNPPKNNRYVQGVNYIELDLTDSVQVKKKLSKEYELSLIHI